MDQQPYQPQYGNTPSQYSNTPENFPGKTMGLVAMILSLASIIGFPTAIVGLILGYVARKQSREAGVSENTFAKVAIIAGWILTILSIVAFIGFFAIFAAAGASHEDLLVGTAEKAAGQIN